MARVPTVDFSLITTGTPDQRSKVIQLLGHACREWGFFVVTLLLLRRSSSYLIFFLGCLVYFSISCVAYTRDLGFNDHLEYLQLGNKSQHAKDADGRDVESR